MYHAMCLVLCCAWGCCFWPWDHRSFCPKPNRTSLHTKAPISCVSWVELSWAVELWAAWLNKLDIAMKIEWNWLSEILVSYGFFTLFTHRNSHSFLRSFISISYIAEKSSMSSPFLCFLSPFSVSFHSPSQVSLCRARCPRALPAPLPRSRRSCCRAGGRRPRRRTWWRHPESEKRRKKSDENKRRSRWASEQLKWLVSGMVAKELTSVPQMLIVICIVY